MTDQTSDAMPREGSTSTLVAGGRPSGSDSRVASGSSAHMTRQQGRKILDMLRCDEADFSDAVIRRAMIATGDIADDSAPEVERTAPAGCRWERPFPGWIDARKGVE